jgi:hypothetical protein
MLKNGFSILKNHFPGSRNNLVSVVEEQCNSITQKEMRRKKGAW